MRDTGSTTCVLKTALVRPEQMTGSYELCMLIDGVVKRYPTSLVELETPYYTGIAKVLCVETPVQDIIIGHIPGARGFESKPEIRQVHAENKQVSIPHKVSQPEHILETGQKRVDTTGQSTETEATATCAAVQTRAMAVKENKPPRPLKINSVQGLDFGPEELIAEQKADETLEKYWELAGQPVEDGKTYLFEKKGVVYRKYYGGQNEDGVSGTKGPREGCCAST